MEEISTLSKYPKAITRKTFRVVHAYCVFERLHVREWPVHWSIAIDAVFQYCTIGNRLYLFRKITRNFKPYPDWFRDFSFIYQIWYNGLDLNRFCAPEHIIEMSNSLILLPFGEK